MPRAEDALGGVNELSGSLNAPDEEQGFAGTCMSKTKELHGKVCSPDHPLNRESPFTNTHTILPLSEPRR